MAKKPSVKQIWFVSPILVTHDGNKPIVYPFQGQAQPDEEMPAPAQPRVRNELRLDPPRQDNGNDYGFAMMRNNIITMAWNTKAAAEEYAKQQASKTPSVAFGVFSCVDVFETTAPTVIEKQFNEQGELIVKGKRDADPASGEV